MTQVTKRFSEAVEYARAAHDGQIRTGTNIPYLYHLLGVAGYVLEYGGTEDQAIAGLLHDVLEDCGEEHEAIIRERFGDTVAAIVSDCTDGTAAAKASHASPEAKRADWLQRKLTYLDHLKIAPEISLLVSGCDKLHNARSIVQDLESPSVGTKVFQRFTAKRDGTLQYYESLARIFTERQIPMAAALGATVQRMHDLADVSERRTLELTD